MLLKRGFMPYRKAKILVVDDEPSACRLMKAILEGEGYSVTTCGDGTMALETARTLQPWAAFLDLNLGGAMDGIDVLAELKAMDPRMTVMMLSASVDVSAAVRATQKGAYNY